MSTSERRNELWEIRTTKEIEEKVFKAHGFNGEKMNKDLELVLMYEQARRRTYAQAPIWMGVAGFSLYNISRFGVLSRTGQGAAVTGLLLGGYLSYSSLTMKL